MALRRPYPGSFGSSTRDHAAVASRLIRCAPPHSVPLGRRYTELQPVTEFNPRKCLHIGTSTSYDCTAGLGATHPVKQTTDGRKSMQAKYAFLLAIGGIALGQRGHR